MYSIVKQKLKICRKPKFVSLKVNYHSLFRCQKMRKGAQLVKLTSIKVVLFKKKSCQLSAEDMLFIEPFFKGSFIQENLTKISLLENVVIIFWEAVEYKFPLVMEYSEKSLNEFPMCVWTAATSGGSGELSFGNVDHCRHTRTKHAQEIDARTECGCLGVSDGRISRLQRDLLLKWSEPPMMTVKMTTTYFKGHHWQ